VAVQEHKVPSPANPRYTARSLVTQIRQRGGHIYRMREWGVFVITDDPELAGWMLGLGGTPFLPRGMQRDPLHPGAFRDSPKGKLKWDIYIHHIPVRGEQTVWEAAYKAEPYEPSE
jgi:hypothetical protein